MGAVEMDMVAAEEAIVGEGFFHILGSFEIK